MSWSKGVGQDKKIHKELWVLDSKLIARDLICLYGFIVLYKLLDVIISNKNCTKNSYRRFYTIHLYDV